MRRYLLVTVVVEAVALCALAALLLFADVGRLGAGPPSVPVFRPPLYRAVIGDRVRYERFVQGEPAGYLEYEILRAFEYKHTTLGREFLVRVIDIDAQRHRRERLMRIRPRAPAHGWLPPRFEEDDNYPAGARPVVRTIRTERFRFRKREVDGFVVEAVIPRESKSDVAERYWFVPGVAVFGVARFERDHGREVLDLLRSEKQGDEA